MTKSHNPNPSETGASSPTKLLMYYLRGRLLRVAPLVFAGDTPDGPVSEVFVALDPSITASQAIAVLKKIIKRIETYGVVPKDAWEVLFREEQEGDND